MVLSAHSFPLTVMILFLEDAKHTNFVALKLETFFRENS